MHQDCHEEPLNPSQPTWQMSQLGDSGTARRETRTCLLASLLAAWIRVSHSPHNAASSAQHITDARFRSHTSHCILIFLHFCCRHKPKIRESNRLAALVRNPQENGDGRRFRPHMKLLLKMKIPHKDGHLTPIHATLPTTYQTPKSLKAAANPNPTSSTS